MAGTEPSRGPPDLQRRCVAIVGAGPSGFYAAEALLATGAVDVHVYDQLPVPFGLVRHGVAPDHQKLKQVTAVFERIAARPGFTFIGNVQVGHAVGIDDLREAYDAVLLATGCESDAALGIPGETLPGVHAAREFVGWYNGHPDFAEGVYDFSHEHAVIVGHGNVALDVARMLVAPVDYLQSTDITPAALGQLAESRVRHVHLVGRRGPAQARFTDKELRQIGASGFCDVHVDPDNMKLGPASRHEIEAKGAAEVARMVTALRDLAERPGTANSRHLHFHFLRSPIEVQGGSRVERLLLEHNELEGGPGGSGPRRPVRSLHFRAGCWCAASAIGRCRCSTPLSTRAMAASPASTAACTTCKAGWWSGSTWPAGPSAAPMASSAPTEPAVCTR